jgi:deazaflavin-dependent oxidoreductase (nitroreductase family)
MPDFVPPENWDSRPPDWVNATLKRLLRMPLLHRLLSDKMLLITFTGRKSGQTYTTPVAYVQEGASVVFLVKRFRKWWHNFEEPAEVTVWLRGKQVTARAEAITDPDALVPPLTAYLQAFPRSAAAYGVSVGETGEPNTGEVRSLAPHVVLVRVTPR